MLLTDIDLFFFWEDVTHAVWLDNMLLRLASGDSKQGATLVCIALCRPCFCHPAPATLLLQPCYISRHNALAAPHLQWSTGWPARQLPCEPLVMEPVTVLAGHVAMAALAFTYSCVFGILALSPALNAAAPSSG